MNCQKAVGSLWVHAMRWFKRVCVSQVLYSWEEETKPSVRSQSEFLAYIVYAYGYDLYLVLFACFFFLSFFYLFGYSEFAMFVV